MRNCRKLRDDMSRSIDVDQNPSDQMNTNEKHEGEGNCARRGKGGGAGRGRRLVRVCGAGCPPGWDEGDCRIRREVDGYYDKARLERALLVRVTVFRYAQGQ